MKRPIDQAKECYGSNFFEIVDDLMERGYVYSGADAFAMAMPHSRAVLMEPNLNKDLDKCDCWFIQYVSGDIKRLLDILDNLPLKFEWIVFNRRDGKYKEYNLERLNEKSKNTKSPATSSTTSNRDLS